MSKGTRPKRGGASRRLRTGDVILGVGGLVTAIVFVPTTIFLMIAMLPTVVVAIFDRINKSTRSLTIGAMNLAGCTPFLIDLWTKSHSIDMAVTLITDPRTIIVVYCAAGAGYLIDWAVSGIVESFMVQRGELRLKEIDKKKSDLIDRWGEEVTGLIPLDEHGFPLDSESNKVKTKD